MKGEREEWQSRRLSKIVIEFKSGLFAVSRVEIPAKALADAGAVYSNKWEFRDEDSVRLPGKCLYLVARAPHEVTKEVWKDKTLHFVIVDGVFESLSLSTPLAEEHSSQEHSFDY